MIALLLATAILLPDGSPATGAQAASLAKEHFVHVTGTGFARPNEPLVVGENGTLEVTQETAGRWILLHDKGYADTTITPETSEVRLNPWCDVSGGVAFPHSPGAIVTYHRTERPRRNDDRGSVFWTSSASILENGGFSIRHVPRGHGSVGLQREEKNERRIQRWRDYVRCVDVPSPGPANLAGGVPVSGRILADELPAIITLASKGPEPSCHGLTDSEGRFEIPGVLPGEYRFSARPDLGSATINIPHRDISVGTESLDLGEIAGTDPKVETDSRVEFDDGLLHRIRAEVAKQSNQTIENIWLGELVHPGGQYGARVRFQALPDAQDPTRALQKMLLLQIPGEPIRKFYPEHDSLGWGFRFGEGPFENVRTFENPLRVFPLTAQTLHLPMQDDVSYEDALALLRAIEAGLLLPDSSRPTSPTRLTSPILPLEQITGIQNGKDGEIKIQTRNRPFGGRFYHFKKLPGGGFEQTGGGGWVS